MKLNKFLLLAIAVKAQNPAELPKGTIIQPEVGPPECAQPEVSVTVLTSY